MIHTELPRFLFAPRSHDRCRAVLHRVRLPLLLGLCSLFWNAAARAQLWDVPPLPPVRPRALRNGIAATIGGESLHISVCRSSVIHFVASSEPSNAIRQSQPWMLDAKDSCPGAKFEVSQTGDAAILTTDKLKIEFSLKWGSVQFSTASGENLLRERNSVPRTYDPTALNGEKTFHVEDRFAPDFSEGLYGLGQHQSGMFNYRGATVELAQNNTDVAIPLLLSSKGYALMWNTASLTHVDNRFPLELNLDSLAGHAIDYYFIYGPDGSTDRRVPEPDRTYTDASQMVIRILSIKGSLRFARRGSWNCAPLS